MTTGLYNAADWLVDRHVRDGRGDRVAVRCQGESHTYADVQRSVRRVQHALHDLGVGAGDRVVLLMNDTPELVAWFVGCLRSGVIAVPVSTMLLAADIAAIAADADATALVVSEQYAAHCPTVAAAAGRPRATVVIDEGGTRLDGARAWSEFSADGEIAAAPTTEDSPAFWLYSSGTTGTPKGVMHVHRNLQATYETYAEQVLAIGPDDRCLSVAKLFFAFGLGNSLTFPFGAGATAILEPGRPTPSGMAALVDAERPTLFFASPGFTAALLDAGLDPDVFGTVRATVTAGEALPADLQRRFSQRFGHPVVDGIGSTEVLHIFISNRLEAQRPGTSGWVVPGYEAVLLDEQGEEVIEADTPGYLHVRGPSTATGYWQRPDASALAFRSDGWVRTGDVYTRSADGCWTFLGRNNDMIKAGGIWVSPAEVEAALVAHPDVLEAAVVGARSAEGLEQTVSFVVARAGHEIDPEALIAHCRQHMAAYKRPARVIPIDELPKTATGKIQRFKLRERLGDD